jgi:hypothetical protein
MKPRACAPYKYTQVGLATSFSMLGAFDLSDIVQMVSQPDVTEL